MKYRRYRVSHSHRIVAYVTFDRKVEPDAVAAWLRSLMLGKAGLLEAKPVSVESVESMGGVERGGETQ